MYTDLVMDHFSNPRNVGEIEDADGVGQIGNPVCGDVMRISIDVHDDRIADVKFKTFGCGAAVATSSMVTEMVKGKTLAEAAGDLEQGGRRGSRRPAAQQDALLQPRRRRPPPRHPGLPGEGGPRGGGPADPQVTPKRTRALVALSGGVDSAVAALRLIDEGRTLETATVRLWPGGDRRSCCSPGALQRARQTAEWLGLPHHFVDREAEFEAAVVAPFAAAYLRRDAESLRELQPGAPGGARRPGRRAGPGARRHRPLRAPRVARRRALRGARRRPRQGSVLHAVGRPSGGAGAARVPPGRDDEARDARRRGGGRPARRGRAREPGGSASPSTATGAFSTSAACGPGPAPSSTVGKVLGTHQGHWRYTIGQRRGLGVSSTEPLYVLARRAAENEVVVGRRNELEVHEVTVRDLVDRGLGDGDGLLVQLRYRSPAVPVAALERLAGRMPWCGSGRLSPGRLRGSRRCSTATTWWSAAACWPTPSERRHAACEPEGV